MCLVFDSPVVLAHRPRAFPIITRIHPSIQPRPGRNTSPRSTAPTSEPSASAPPNKTCALPAVAYPQPDNVVGRHSCRRATAFPLVAESLALVCAQASESKAVHSQWSLTFRQPLCRSRPSSICCILDQRLAKPPKDLCRIRLDGTHHASTRIHIYSLSP